MLTKRIAEKAFLSRFSLLKGVKTSKGKLSEENVNTIIDIMEFVTVIIREKSINFDSLRKTLSENTIKYYLYDDKYPIIRIEILEFEQDKAIPMSINSVFDLDSDYNTSSNHYSAGSVYIMLDDEEKSSGLDSDFVNVIRMGVGESKFNIRTSDSLTAKLRKVDFEEDNHLSADMDVKTTKNKIEGIVKYHQVFVRLLNRTFDKEKCLLVPVTYTESKDIVTDPKGLI